MKKIIFYLPLLLLAANAFSQETKIAIRVSGNTNIAKIEDFDPRPSSQFYIADGHTVKEGDVGGVSLGANLDYHLNDNFALSPGLWITKKGLLIRNTDASYSGVSQYDLTYLQIPLLAKFYTNEVADNLKLFLNFGPTIDLKINEQLGAGGDGAHYWNLSRNMYHLDTHRGRNGENRPMKLFHPLDLGLFFSFGPEYALSDKFSLFLAISYNLGLVNMINPNLTFNVPLNYPAEMHNFPVNESIRWRSRLLAFDVGVRF